MFYSIVTALLLAYIFINAYIFLHLWKIAKNFKKFRIIFIVLFVVLVFSYIAGNLVYRVWGFSFPELLILVGAFWFALMIYFLIGFFLFDLAAVFLKLFSIKSFSILPKDRLKNTVLIFIVIVSMIIVLLGRVNAKYPAIKELNIDIKTDSPGTGNVNIAIISDIHLGVINGSAYLEKLVSRLNKIKPDLVLLPGDIVDEAINPALEKIFGNIIKNIKAPLGIYAVTGNHEYIGGIENSLKFLKQSGIKVLNDKADLVGGMFYVVGRKDRSSDSFSGQNRKSLAEILKPLVKRFPVILMDHQPVSIHESITNNVDLHISGHTHGGQIWPGNYVTRLFFNIIYGYHKMENTHIYVSCGYGTWGPPVRTGNRPEIVNIKLMFNAE